MAEGPRELERRYRAIPKFGNEWKGSDIKPTDKAPIIGWHSRPITPGTTPYEIEIIPWGWKMITEQGKSKLVINTRSDTFLKESRFYATALKRDRVILPATSFIEWPNNHKTKFHKEGEIFSIGGYTALSNVTSGHSVFCMITVPAGNELEGVHAGPLGDHRQPFLIPRDLEEAWLDPKLSREKVLGLMKSYPMGLKAEIQGQLPLL